MNCYRWVCSLSAAAAAGGAAAASWALPGCSPLGPGFQICCCKGRPSCQKYRISSSFVAVESAAGHGGRMDGKTLIGRRLHTQPEEEEEEEEERKKKKKTR